MNLSVGRKCRINGMQPEMCLALIAIQQAASNTVAHLVITHIRDGVHSDKSLHYVGFAVDVAPSEEQPPEEIDKIELDLKLCLTPEYDLVSHYDDSRFTHWHIEFQPKGSTGDRLYA